MNGKFFVLCLSLFALSFAEVPLPRTVIAIYDSQATPEIAESIIHQAAEMPLNHLGLKLKYVDIHGELPDIGEDPDIAGVLVWVYQWDIKEKATVEKFLYWAIKTIKADKRFVMMGSQPFDSPYFKIDNHLLNQFWRHLGLKDTGEWDTKTFTTQLHFNCPDLLNFERKYPPFLPSFQRMVPIDKGVECCLTARKGSDRQTEACLISFNENGAYVANEYAVYWLYEKGRSYRNWYINPFLFFEKAFALKGLPRLDTTTLAGRRIYYSHVDGDGWNSISQIYEYRKEKALSVTVLHEEIFKGYPNLPVTIAPIGADIDVDWYGREEGIETLNKMIELPYVELATHTFTHPFEWAFFKDYSPRDELPYVHLYPKGSWVGGGIVAWMKVRLGGVDVVEVEEEVSGYDPKGIKTFSDEYTVPRAFALKPFDLSLEVEGAIDLTNKLVNYRKKVDLYQWSGDCRPFLAAMEKVDAAGIPNLNGGDTRFDNKFNSYSWVKPLGRQVGKYLQVYSSNSNENTYTDYWRDNFHAFNMLPETLKNTEVPIRVKPINLYYHVYSAEKHPGLEALKQNLAYIKTQETIPIHAKEFCEIVEAFFEAKVFREEGDIWSVENRGNLQTVRFDKASEKVIDFAESTGVIGQCHTQGSLYIFFDPAVEKPRFKLKNSTYLTRAEREDLYYLIGSSWKVSHLKQEGKQAEFQVDGYSDLSMHWNVPEEGSYEIQLGDAKPLLTQSKNHQIHFSIPLNRGEAMKMRLTSLGESE